VLVGTGGDRERRPRHRDGGPLQRGGPRCRRIGAASFQRLHRSDGGGTGALADSRAALRRKAAERIGEETARRSGSRSGLARSGSCCSRFPSPPAARARRLRSRRARRPTSRASPGLCRRCSSSRVFRAHHRGVQARAVMAINLVYSPPKFRSTCCLSTGVRARPSSAVRACAIATADRELADRRARWVYCAKHPFYAPFRIFGRWSWPHLPTLWNHLKLGVPIGLALFVEVYFVHFHALFLARLGAALGGTPDRVERDRRPLHVRACDRNATAVLTAQAIARVTRARRGTRGSPASGSCSPSPPAPGVAIFFGRGGGDPVHHDASCRRSPRNSSLSSRSISF